MQLSAKILLRKLDVKIERLHQYAQIITHFCGTIFLIFC